MQTRIRTIHKYISLAFALLWLLQGITGMLIAFRWELDDALTSGPTAPLDIDALSDRVEGLNNIPGQNVSSVWTSGGGTDDFDIFIDADNGPGKVVRVSGNGTILRDRTDDTLWADGAIFDTATSLHASLMSGDTGHWLLGISGLLLLTNIGLGLKLAWPKANKWRQTMLTRPRGAAAAKLYGWHKLAGLWLALPALVVITFGSLLAFSEPLEAWIVPPAPNTASPTTEITPSDQSAAQAIPPARAIRIAREIYPDAVFSGLYLPTVGQSYYTVRLLSADEPAQKFGKTTVVLDALDGHVLRTEDFHSAPGERRVLNFLYPLHTGQIAGLPGRIVTGLVSLWLITMISLGISLYIKRRKKTGKYPEKSRTGHARPTTDPC